MIKLIRSYYTAKRVKRRAYSLRANIREYRKNGTQLVFIRQDEGGFAGKTLIFVAAYIGLINESDLDSKGLEIQLDRLKNYPALYETIITNIHNDEIQRINSIPTDPISRIVIETSEEIEKYTSCSGWTPLENMKMHSQGIYN